MKNASIAIFASGSGSNARRIIEHFKGHQRIHISAVFTNKAGAGVIQIAEEHNIPVKAFTREEFYSPDSVLNDLKENGITHIVLAGFLWLIPPVIIRAFDNRIVNIHPALLPKYGGKGMFGINVHTAVKNAGEKETGITIHLVNENYDEGKYLVQQKIVLNGHETVDEIAVKVQQLEHEYFPISIEKWIEESYSRV